MQRIKITVYLACAVLVAAFLAACSGIQTTGRDSGYGSYGGGSGGHQH